MELPICILSDGNFLRYFYDYRNGMGNEMEMEWEWNGNIMGFF